MVQLGGRLMPSFLLAIVQMLSSTKAGVEFVLQWTLDQPVITWGNHTKLQGSRWTEWSVCSRTCGVGVTQQLRRCRNESFNPSETCDDDLPQARYKLCNIQACEQEEREPWEEWRSFMCSAYDSIPYGEGGSQRLQWTPVHEPLEPCALVCRGVELGHSEPASPVVLAALAPQVPDGTRCHPHALHVCIAGTCQDVSCKSFMGAVLNISCVDWDYYGNREDEEEDITNLRPVPISECSVTCGKGWQSVMYEGKDRSVKRIERVPCEGAAGQCPPVWFVGQWENCTCSGMHERVVICGREGYAMSDSKCPKPVPEATETCKPPPSCNDSNEWLIGPWSPERKKRAVRMYRSESQDNEIEGSNYSAISEDEIQTISRQYDGFLTPDIIRRMPPNMLPRKPTYRWRFDEHWSHCNVKCGQGWKKLFIQCEVLLENSKLVGIVSEEMCKGERAPVPRLQACTSNSCGTATQDPAPKASLVHPVSTQDSSYTWRETGYTSCSASCLSGVQELIISCIRDSDGKNASPYMCDPRLRPESRVRTCNDHPCPPRWNISEYGPCDKPCGIGMQEREVFCMHEVTRGSSNRVRVPHSMCPLPMPTDRQFCNAFDCPPAWKAENWSECSRSCGQGSRIRRVYCHQMMVQFRNEELPAHMCSHMPKPIESEACGIDCQRDRRVSTTLPPPTSTPGVPHIISQNVSYHQHDGRLRYVTTAMGGHAVIMHGTMLRIHCPSVNIDTSTIEWYHDGRIVEDSEYYKIFPEESAMRIESVEFVDSGNWECRAKVNNKTIINTGLFLSVKSRTLTGSSEELGKSSHAKPGRGHQSLHYRNDGQDEHSHEREFLVTPKPRRFTTLPPPTLPATMRPYQPPTKPPLPNQQKASGARFSPELLLGLMVATSSLLT